MATSLSLENDSSLQQGYIKVNGTTAATVTAGGLSTPQATIGSINGLLKATSGVVSQAVAGTDYISSTSGGLLTLGTAQTASGTSVDFTGIPSWVKRITVMYDGVSTNGATGLLIQVGAGSILSSGYLGAASRIAVASASTINYTAGFGENFDNAPGGLRHGNIILNNINSNTWTVNGIIARSDTTATHIIGGKISLSGTLDRVRIATTNAIDQLDAGTINIMYEG